ncbi:Oxidoreductase [Lysobacter dokdonensis DS-58]|uniref:Oxidoreductase n=1 Tax=Lysobacter dokdonensis DS-58 TaxID=1300345 RepID=A0A0A2WKL3_9GAMM|nr:Oxidoreductase [Lysobacter dokdonensis DS-58]
MGIAPIAVVGFGRRGRLHAQALATMPEVHLAAIVDPDAACANDIAALGAARHATIDLLAPSIRHAIVAVPPERHAQVACALARRGVHCLIETPGGARADDTAAMIAASDIDGTCMRVAFGERFNPVIASLLAAPPPATLAIRRHTAHAIDIPRDGDVLRELMLHDLDWVCALAKASPVQVDVLDARRHYERWEAIRCRLRFPNGMDVDLSASRIAPRAESALHVAGQGVLPLDDVREHPGTLTAQARAFLRATQDEDTPLATLERAFDTHRLLERIERAAGEQGATHAA